MSKEVIFDGEKYELIENVDGTKTIKTEKNKRGFKVTITCSNNDAEIKEADKAIKNFFVREIL